MSETLRDFIPGQDEPAIANLWSRSFGDAVGGQTLEWLFRTGAAGPCPRSVSEVDGKIVAHAGVTALSFVIEGEEVSGGYSVGAMTDPAYRGRGLYARLGAYLYERLEADGFAFVAGFSNQQSHRLMTGPLERTGVRPFPWCVRILRPLAVVKGLLGGKGSVPVPLEVPQLASDNHQLSAAGFDAPQLNELWERIAPGVRVGAVRNRDFAASRYGTRPEAGYRALAVEKDGRFVAWGVHRTISVRGQRATFLVDFEVAPGEQGAGQFLLRTLGQEAHKNRVSMLSALLPGEGAARDALRGAGFLQIPERLHPQLIRFSVRGFGPYRGSSLLANPGAWRLSWADTDVV